jgi:citrate lyase subunit beta/citryl-CoA lyase
LLGYDGKWAIHPSQIPIAMEVFSPSAADVERAHRLIEAYRKGEADGRGATSLDGMLVDAAHLRHAANVLRLVGDDGAADLSVTELSGTIEEGRN